MTHQTSKVQLVKDTIEILHGPEVWAKEMLEDRWDHPVRHCLMGALNLAYYGTAAWPAETLGGVSNVHNAWGDVVQILDELCDCGHNGPYGWGNVVCFNNAPETTYEDIRMLLKETLERCYEEEAK